MASPLVAHNAATQAGVDENITNDIGEKSLTAAFDFSDVACWSAGSTQAQQA